MRSGRVVVVTGAAGGIGSAIVDRFVRNGDTVVATDVRLDELRRLHDGTRGSSVVLCGGDVTSERDCAALYDAAARVAARVDVLVNCAGYYPIVAFEEMTLAAWRRVVDVNLTGAFLVTKAILPLMKTRGWGRIVNVGSASTYEGVAEQAHYVAAKAGIVGFSRSIARALGGYGITVNVLAPGLTLSPPVLEHTSREMRDAQPPSRAIGRDEREGDLVGTVFFLASPDADFVSGQTIVVDGGRHMN